MRDTSLRVLYLHPAAAFGGASKSLVELYGMLAKQGVRGTVITPAGTASTAFSAAGLDVRVVRGLSQFDNTCYGYYRGVRWLILLLREFSLIPFALSGLWKLRQEKFDVIHINEITLLPLGLFAKYILRAPLVVHVRSLQRQPGIDWRSRRLASTLRRRADAVVAIDHTVASTLERDLPLSIIHNGIKLASKTPKAAERLGGPIRVGFLGVLIPLKGIFELVEAVEVLKARGVSIQCLVAGEDARKLSGPKAWLLRKFGFARNVRAELEALILAKGLGEEIKLIGFYSDVRDLYPQIDVLCFPSHLDAAGRPVFEAALYSIPSVVAVDNPKPDAIIHEVTGLAVPSPDSLLIADAIQRLVEDPELRTRLGCQAKAWAEQTFSLEKSAAKMLDVYRRITSFSRGR